MDIIQIVGYKNSGKTTLCTKLIETLVQNRYRTASLKHHGHGGIPVGLEETDSFKHKEAGAYITGVEGDGLLQLSSDNWKLEQLISIYELFEIDVLVMEGYKRANYPKIVMLRDEKDLSLLEELDNIIAVVSSVNVENFSIDYPIFSRLRLADVCQFYLKYLIDN